MDRRELRRALQRKVRAREALTKKAEILSDFSGELATELLYSVNDLKYNTHVSEQSPDLRGLVEIVSLAIKEFNKQQKLGTWK